MDGRERDLRDQAQAMIDGKAGPAIFDQLKREMLIHDLHRLADDLERLATDARRTAETIRQLP